MDYQNIYDNLCKRGQLRVLSEEIYTENHHIVPRCLGGGNCRGNLTRLTAREHFIGHKLLCRIYPTNRKLLFALHAMSTLNAGNQRRYIPNSKEYAEIKEAAIAAMRQWKKENPPTGTKNAFYGKKHSVESRRKMSVSALKSYENGKIPNRLGKKQSNEAILKSVESKRENLLLGKTRPSFLGKAHSLESRALMSLAKQKAVGIDSCRKIRVKHIETGLEFNLIKEAMDYFGITWPKFNRRYKKGEFEYLKN